MKYYRVKPIFDNYKKNTTDIFVGNELYTENEVNKLDCVYKDMFDIVEINKNNTHFFFGARFEN